MANQTKAEEARRRAVLKTRHYRDAGRDGFRAEATAQSIAMGEETSENAIVGALAARSVFDTAERAARDVKTALGNGKMDEAAAAKDVLDAVMETANEAYNSARLGYGMPVYERGVADIRLDCERDVRLALQLSSGKWEIPNDPAAREFYAVELPRRIRAAGFGEIADGLELSLRQKPT